ETSSLRGARAACVGRRVGRAGEVVAQRRRAVALAAVAAAASAATSTASSTTSARRAAVVAGGRSVVVGAVLHGRKPSSTGLPAQPLAGIGADRLGRA